MRGDSLRGNSRIVGGSRGGGNGFRSHVHSKTVARRIGSSCKKRLFIAFFRSRHTDDVVRRPFHVGWLKNGEVRRRTQAEESRLLPVPDGHREGNYRTGQVGALGEFGDFFVGDQLVLYINDRRCTDYPSGFLRAGPSFPGRTSP